MRKGYELDPVKRKDNIQKACVVGSITRNRTLYILLVTYNYVQLNADIVKQCRDTRK